MKIKRICYKFHRSIYEGNLVSYEGEIRHLFNKNKKSLQFAVPKCRMHHINYKGQVFFTFSLCLKHVIIRVIICIRTARASKIYG